MAYLKKYDLFFAFLVSLVIIVPGSNNLKKQNDRATVEVYPRNRILYQGETLLMTVGIENISGEGEIDTPLYSLKIPNGLSLTGESWKGIDTDSGFFMTLSLSFKVSEEVNYGENTVIEIEIKSFTTDSPQTIYVPIKIEQTPDN